MAGSKFKRRRLFFWMIALFGIFCTTAEAQIPEEGKILPPQMEGIWQSGQSALDRGDLPRVERVLEGLIRERNRLGPLVLPEFSTLLVFEGGKALERGDLPLARRLGAAAVEFSPSYLPGYSLQSRVLLRESITQIPQALLLYADGIAAASNDFRGLLHFVGVLAFIVIMALFLTLFSGGVILIARTAPLYHHSFKEMTGDFSSGARIILWGILICLTLVFHPGWGLVFWIVLAWIYLSRKERFWAGLTLFILLLLPIASIYLAYLYRADEDPLLRTLAAAREGTVYSAAIPRSLERGESPTIVPEMRKSAEALLWGRLHRWEEAGRAYREILNDDPESRIALINLGNAAFHQERFDEAIEFYRTALRAHPDSATAAFNLGQTYKEKLLFAEGNKSLGEARRLNREAVEKWIDDSKKGRGFAVVDETLPRELLWQAAFQQARMKEEVGDQISRALFSLPRPDLPLAGGGILAALILLSFMKGGTPMAYSCPRCAKVVCARCTGSRFYGKVCRECRVRDKAGVLNDRSSGKENQAAKTLWAFLLPGSLKTFQGKPFNGMVRSFLFFSALLGLTLHWLWRVPSYYPIQGGGAIPGLATIWIVILAGLYLSVLLELKIIRIKFKSK